ncbi:MAG: ribose-phosphate diphosphokinase [Candidatus Doudnabacteria bacterium]
MQGIIKIFAGLAGMKLARQVCEQLSIPPGEALVGRFPDGEAQIQLKENVRGADVFIINPLCSPAENLLDMLFLTDASQGSSAGRITLVIPYLGWNRQDRKDKPRMATSAEVVISILANSGCDRVLLMDVHSEPTISIFRTHDIITDHLYGSHITLEYLRSILRPNSVIATPDAGGSRRARAYARRLGLPTVVCDKERSTESGHIAEGSVLVLGDVRGKDVIFVDDMIDTAGTLYADAKAVRALGAERILAVATHALFSGNALERLDESLVDEVIVTDTIPHEPDALKTSRVKITTLSVAGYLAKAIAKINRDESLSDMFL